MKIFKIFNSKPNFVNIHNDLMYSGTAKQLELSKDVLENYAKHKNIKVDIYSGQHALEDETPVIEKYVNKLQIVVTDMKTQKDKFKFVASHPKEIVKNTKSQKCMINDGSEGTQRMAYVKSTYEDNLVRRVYRAVEQLSKSVKK